MGLVVLQPLAAATTLVGTAAGRAALTELVGAFSWNAAPIAVDTAAGYATWKIGVFILMMAIWPLLAGSRMLRGEEERGSLDVLLSTPRRRVRVAVEKLGHGDGAARYGTADRPGDLRGQPAVQPGIRPGRRAAVRAGPRARLRRLRRARSADLAVHARPPPRGRLDRRPAAGAHRRGLGPPALSRHRVVLSGLPGLLLQPQQSAGARLRLEPWRDARPAGAVARPGRHRHLALRTARRRRRRAPAGVAAAAAARRSTARKPARGRLVAARGLRARSGDDRRPD